MIDAAAEVHASFGKEKEKIRLGGRFVLETRCHLEDEVTGGWHNASDFDDIDDTLYSIGNALLAYWDGRHEK